MAGGRLCGLGVPGRPVTSLQMKKVSFMAGAERHIEKAIEFWRI